MSATEFKAKCLGVLDEVTSGAAVVITKRGKAVARLTRATHRRRPLMGGMAGTSEEGGDIVHFETTGLWKSAR